MNKLLNLFKYTGITIYALYLFYILIWNKTNHTGFEPLYLLLIPSLFIALAFISKDKKIRNSLIILSLAMVSISAFIEVSNGMLNYQRWAQSGMPSKWSW